jgi:hypothetical protein
MTDFNLRAVNNNCVFFYLLISNNFYLNISTTIGSKARNLFLSVRDSSAGHFPQVVRVDISNGVSSVVASSNAASLTHGKFEVTQLVDWDEDNHLV